MLCEGVFLYMMLVTVFGNKLNNQYFFFILGWGKAIFVIKSVRVFCSTYLYNSIVFWNSYIPILNTIKSGC